MSDEGSFQDFNHMDDVPVSSPLMQDQANHTINGAPLFYEMEGPIEDARSWNTKFKYRLFRLFIITRLSP